MGCGSSVPAGVARPGEPPPTGKPAPPEAHKEAAREEAAATQIQSLHRGRTVRAELTAKRTRFAASVAVGGVRGGSGGSIGDRRSPTGSRGFSLEAMKARWSSMPVFLAEQSKDYQGLEVNRDDLHRMAVCGPSPDAPHESLPVVAGGMAPEEAARLRQVLFETQPDQVSFLSMLKLGDAGLDGLVQLLTPQHVTAGEVVFAQGSTLIDSCYFVESGELEVCRCSKRSAAIPVRTTSLSLSPLQVLLQKEETGDPERIATIRGPGGCKPRHRPPAAVLRGPRLSAC